MSQMEGFASKLVGTASAMKLKTNDFLRSMDSKMEINRMEEEIEELYFDIGENVCKFMDSGERINITIDIKEKYEKIQTLKKGILYKKRILSNTIKGAAYCDRCGEILERGICYCPICGKKL